MWEEDEEEEEREREREMEARKKMNARSWSRESKEEAKKIESPSHPHDIKGNVDDDLVADGFFFQDVPTPKAQITVTPRYTHQAKQHNNHHSDLDKWAALGERRRGTGSSVEADRSPELKPRRHFGIGYNKSYEAGVWDHSNHHYHNKFGAKERVKECPWNKGRDWNWRRDRRADLGDVEWVGGW